MKILLVIWAFSLISVFQMHNLFLGYGKVFPISVIVAVSIALAIVGNGRLVRYKGVAGVIFGLYLFVSIVSYIRSPSYYLNGIVFLVMILSIIVGVGVWGRHAVRHHISSMGVAKFIISPLLFYVCISLFLYAAGIKGSWSENLLEDYSSGGAQLLGVFGVQVERVKFYLSNGVNAFAPVAGLLAVMGFTGLTLGGKEGRAFYFACFLFGGVALLLVDGRGAIVYGILSYLMVMLAGKNPRISSMFVILCPLLAPFLIIAVGLVVEYQLLPGLVRGENDVTLNSRGVIWALAVSKFDFLSINSLIGYGYEGHRVVGLGSSFARYFENDLNAKNLSMHNSYLHILYDVGFLGLACFLMMFRLIVVGVVRVSMNGNEYSLVAKLMLVSVYFLLLYGNTEAVVVGRSELFFYLYFLIFCFLTIFSQKRGAGFVKG
ncbi:O-antigen ligase family protein [Spongiibacter sp. UBA1325]|uniref:O-antigen ligase family protein n=1 Tax=Spongiibacter sp. UBA1325 TaxID=1947543 RepID=UPI00257C02BB|nr:O-antigen ligase family protein [Spongiibacter sp. UBA1325]